MASAESASASIAVDHGRFHRPADLAVVLVVDPRHLLIAHRHHPQLPRRAAVRVADDAPGADREPREIGAQPLRFRVVPDDADDLHAAAERRDVVGDVGGAAEPVLLVIEPDDRHRGLRRDPLHAAEHEVIEHEVADDEDGAAREARGHVFEPAHVDGWTGVDGVGADTRGADGAASAPGTAGTRRSAA